MKILRFTRQVKWPFVGFWGCSTLAMALVSMPLCAVKVGVSTGATGKGTAAPDLEVSAKNRFKK